MDKHVENMDNSKVIRINKKILMVLLSELIIFCGCAAAFAQGEEGYEGVVHLNEENSPRTDIIRLHVRANSDTEEDQKLKLKVRNAVIDNLQAELEQVISPESCGKELDMEARAETLREYTKNNLGRIEGWAKDIIEDEGYTYDAQASFGVTWIPEKTYDGIYFPAGNYEALNINIGEGIGENWWCVIFPPLCLIGSDEEFDEDEASVLFESNNGSRLILKSKILELLSKEKND